MNEVQVWIEADSPNLERLRRVPEMIQRDTGNANIDGLPDHVQTMRRDSGARPATLAQQRVRLRRSVPGDDVKRLIGFQRPAELSQQIEHSRINRFDFVDPEVAHDVI